MPRFLNTIGLSSLAIAVCDRCKMKYPYANQLSDKNIPAIKVCSTECQDEFDPYRLAPRPTERISLRFPRPDVDVAQAHNNLILDPDMQNKNDIGIALEQGNTPNDGNLNVLSP